MDGTCICVRESSPEERWQHLGQRSNSRFVTFLVLDFRINFQKAIICSLGDLLIFLFLSQILADLIALIK